MVEEKVFTAGIYIRVSTEHQAKEGYSLEAQENSLRKFVDEQGWKLFDLYADKGISGKNIKGRPDVKRLIQDIEQKKIDIVVSYKFDRLTRDMRDTEEIMNLIQQYGIQVYTISGGSVDVGTATGRFSVRISGAVAQLEREQTIERVRFAFEQKVKNGYTLASSTTSYGYNRKKHEKEQTINAVEAKVVKRIFNMYTTGKTLTEICKILNAEQIPTKMNGRKLKKRNSEERYVLNSLWQSKTIRLILSNPTYIGKVRYHIGKSSGFTCDGIHEAIISEKLWKEAQEKLLKIKSTTRTNLPKDDVYYCGTLVCGICGKKLTTNRTVKNKKDGSKATFNGYRCVEREKGICTCLGISHPKVEKAFLEYISNVVQFTEIDKLDIQPEDDVDLEHIKTLKQQINQFSKKKKEIMDLFMNNSIDHEQLQYMTVSLVEKKKLLEEELVIIEKKYKPINKIEKSNIANTIKEHWQYLSNRERLDFLTNFVKEIVIVNRDRDKINGKPEIIDVKFYE
jgi:site-specific DNA recombinase